MPEVRKAGASAGTRTRTSAMAQSVPSTMATAVETAATCSETTSAGKRPRVLASRSYQRSDQSGGGRVKTVEEPNDTATVTTSGVIKNTTVPAATIQMKARV